MTSHPPDQAAPGPRRAIGAISGTSMDGIDVAMIETDGERVLAAGPGRTYPYSEELRGALSELLADPGRARNDPLDELERAVTLAHTGAIGSFLTDTGLDCSQIDIVGLHGQTVLHQPEDRFTRQLGDARLAADVLRIDTVSQFRQADVASGGEGAPFAPLYHRAITQTCERPLIVLNLGGVGNITYVDDETVLAFDTGPASALIDDFVARRTGADFDEGGRLAAAGRADDAIVENLLDDPFFALAPPKSLDRNHFHGRATMVERLSTEDGVATLAHFTVEATLLALEHTPHPPSSWLVCGGGRHNRHFMKMLASRARVPVRPIDEIGYDGDFIEAQCFGFLAVRSQRGLPLSLPTTTGVPEPMPGGQLAAA